MFKRLCNWARQEAKPIDFILVAALALLVVVLLIGPKSQQTELVETSPQQVEKIVKPYMNELSPAERHTYSMQLKEHKLKCFSVCMDYLPNFPLEGLNGTDSNEYNHNNNYRSDYVDEVKDAYGWWFRKCAGMCYESDLSGY